MITVIWDTWLKTNAADEGLEIIRRIWFDMTKYKGYSSHKILLDNDQNGHIMIISHWDNRRYADEIKSAYANSENVKLLSPLLSRPRNRIVLSEDVTL